MKAWPRQLPWIDGLAGLTVGVLVLTLRPFVVSFYGLSLEVVTFIGLANMGYSVFGIILGALRARKAALLYSLILANFIWGAVCVVMAARLWSTAGIFGLAHIIGEGLFVTGLALLELRHRREILSPRPVA
jgi:hypothetical protein